MTKELMRPEGPPREGPMAEAADGARTILPVLVGLVPFGLVLGALGAKAGLSPLEVGLMSAIVFAGSAQFAAIELWATPVPIAALALTALFMNARHVLMGIAIAPHLGRFGRGELALTLFLMADEIWAIAMRRGQTARLTPAFYLGMALIFWASWVLFTMLGAFAGALVDDPAAWGFDFAFVAVFMVLLRAFWRGPRTALIWLASGAASFAMWSLFDGPWYVIAGALAGITAGTIVPATDQSRTTP